MNVPENAALASLFGASNAAGLQAGTGTTADLVCLGRTDSPTDEYYFSNAGNWTRRGFGAAQMRKSTPEPSRSHKAPASSSTASAMCRYRIDISGVAARGRLTLSGTDLANPFSRPFPEAMTLDAIIDEVGDALEVADTPTGADLIIVGSGVRHHR